MKTVSWWDVYMCEDPTKASQIFNDKFNTVYDKHAPIRKIQVRSNYASWLSNETKELMIERDEAMKTAEQHKDGVSWDNNKKIQNLVNGRVKVEKLN